MVFVQNTERFIHPVGMIVTETIIPVEFIPKDIMFLVITQLHTKVILVNIGINQKVVQLEQLVLLWVESPVILRLQELPTVGI